MHANNNNNSFIFDQYVTVAHCGNLNTLNTVILITFIIVMVSSFIYRCYTLLDLPYVVTGGLLFYPWCLLSFFFSPTVLRAPLTDRPETLPPDRNLRVFYDARPKIGGGASPKKLGAKNMQNFRRFWTTSNFDREYLGNGPTYPKSADVTNYGNSCCVWWQKARWTLVH